jgi:hypothetical protein
LLASEGLGSMALVFTRFRSRQDITAAYRHEEKKRKEKKEKSLTINIFIHILSKTPLKAHRAHIVM